MAARGVQGENAGERVLGEDAGVKCWVKGLLANANSHCMDRVNMKRQVGKRRHKGQTLLL